MYVCCGVVLVGGDKCLFSSFFFWLMLKQKESKEKAGMLKGYIASGSRDKTIKFWDLATGRCVATFVCDRSCLWTTNNEPGRA